MGSTLFGNQSTGTPNQANQQDPNQIKDIFRSSTNPMATMQVLASQGNQRAQAALSYLQNGMTPKQAVLNILQQRGIPFQTFLQNPLFKN